MRGKYKMNGISAIAKKSQSILCEDRTTWIDLYYSFKLNTVYVKPGKDRHKVTTLINPNTPDDIIEAVERWKMM